MQQKNAEMWPSVIIYRKGAMFIRSVKPLAGACALLVLLLLSGFGRPQLSYWQGCARGVEDDCRHIPTWQKSDGVLYIAESGRVYRMNAASGKAGLLADHGFWYISRFTLSPSTGAILYQGFSRQDGFTSYIYDIRRGTSLRFPGVGHVTFSPDGRFAAQENMYAAVAAKHVLLADLEPYPPTVLSLASPIDTATLGDYRRTELQWGPDSRRVYLGLVAFVKRGGAQNCAYFSYDIRQKKFARIAGRFVNSMVGVAPDEGFHYSVNGKEVALAAPPPRRAGELR
jgi:hypothetical protein